MALGTFIAGQYTSAFNSVAVGMTADGYKFRVGAKAQMIEASDAYADTLLDFVYRGGRAKMLWRAIEFTSGNQLAAWPFGAFGVISDTTTPIGRLASAIAAALVLTATAATPAASTPATMTSSKAILDPDYEVETLFDSRLREIPMQMILLPYTASTAVIFASKT
jgi:hypothetical protein